MPKKQPTAKEISAIDSKADRTSESIASEVEGRINGLISGSHTLVLGDHVNLELLKKITKSLKDAEIPSLYVKLVKSNINEILKSKLFMKESDFIIMIDGKGAGTVGEVHYAVANKNIASKLHLFVNESKRDLVWDYKKYYLFFPRFDFWKSKKNLVGFATKIAGKEIHRLAYLSILEETQCWGCQHIANTEYKKRPKKQINTRKKR